MVSLKCLVVLILVVAVCCPSSATFFKRQKRCRIGADRAINHGLKRTLRFLFRGLKKHCRFHHGLYRDLINIKVPTNLDGALSFILRVGLGCGSAINIFIPGLGDLVGRIVAAVLRILACILGLFGNCGYCGHDYSNSYLGVSVKGVNDIDALLDKYNCRYATKQVNDFINKNGGIGKFKGSRRAILRTVLELAAFLDSPKKLVKADATRLFEKILTISGLIGNSYSAGLGQSVTDNAIGLCGKFLVDAGCPALESSKPKIGVVIKDADDDDDAPWATLPDNGNDNDSDDDDDDNDNDDDNKGNNNNQGNDNDNNKGNENDNNKGNDNDNNKGNDNDNNKGNDNDNNKGNDNDNNKGNDNDDNKGNDNDNNNQGNDNNNNNNNDDDDDANDNNTSVSSPLGGYFDILFKPIRKGRGSCRVSDTYLINLVNLGAPKSFVDVANIIGNLSIVVSRLIDSLIKGLGSLVGRVSLVLAQGSLCCSGKSLTGFCTNKYGDAFGIKGSATDIGGYITLYKIKEAKKQMLKIIKKKTRGKGVKDVIKGGQRALLQSCLNLATYVDNYSANDAFSNLYLEITKILGIIGNSYQTDLGDKITKSLSSSCDQYVSQKGYQDISTNSEDVKSTIQTAKSDRTFKVIMTTTQVVTVNVTQTTYIEESESQQTELQQS